MDLSARDESGHHLQGPHTELHHERVNAPTPLRLRVYPDDVVLELCQPSVIVGRHSQADVRLVLPEVSRRHCRITFEEGRWRIVDLTSLNGVWVNGDRVHEAVLYDGDRVRIGGCTIAVERGTPVRVRGRKTDPEIEVLQSIADALPKAS